MQFTYDIGDIIQIPSPTGYRVWWVVGRHFGATRQEDSIALFPLDKTANEEIQVPVDMLNAIPNQTNFGREMVAWLKRAEAEKAK